MNNLMSGCVKAVFHSKSWIQELFRSEVPRHIAWPLLPRYPLHLPPAIPDCFAAAGLILALPYYQEHDSLVASVKIARLCTSFNDAQSGLSSSLVY